MKKSVLLLFLPFCLVCSSCNEEVVEPTDPEILNGDVNIKENNGKSEEIGTKTDNDETTSQQTDTEEENEINSTTDVEVSSETKIKNIIYVIGDGMGFNAIKGGELYSNSTFEFTKWLTLSANTRSLDSNTGKDTKTTDSAAGGTALATGTLTINGYIGRDKDLKDLETVFDVAKEVNKSVGIVTTDTIGGATPAAFSAHSNSRNNAQEILESQANSELDLLIGKESSTYENKKNLFIEKNFTYSNKLDRELLSKERLLINNKGMTPYTGSNTLKDSTKFAVDYLSQNENGFALMIEQAYIDKNSHSNKFEDMARSVVELNETMDYLINRYKNQNDTLIILTADHETGSLDVSSDTNLENIYSKDGISFSYHYKSDGHTSAYVPVYLNKDIFDFNFIDAKNEYPLIKNIEIAKGIKNLLKSS